MAVFVLFLKDFLEIRPTFFSDGFVVLIQKRKVGGQKINRQGFYARFPERKKREEEAREDLRVAAITEIDHGSRSIVGIFKGVSNEKRSRFAFLRQLHYHPF